MRLYIIRHADPDYEKGTITPIGHKEAIALSYRLKSEKINKIFSSPLKRAIDTMLYTEKITKIKGSIIDWVKEIDDWYKINAPFILFSIKILLDFLINKTLFNNSIKNL
jgi:probable phosphoglycerate mutase